MSLKLPVIFAISYLLHTLVQLVAALDGIMYFFGLHWIFAFFAAFLLALIPAIGPLAGVYGAVQAWGWPAWAAVLLFFWPYILYAVMLSLGITSSFFFWKKAFKPFKEKNENVIEPEFTVKEDSDEKNDIFYIERK